MPRRPPATARFGGRAFVAALCSSRDRHGVGLAAERRRSLARLAKIGVRIAIDDFVTGPSGLSALRRLPTKELKLNQAFVAGIADSPESQAAARAFVKMARALSLAVVAEGVETDAQRSMLVELGCDQLQGWLFAKPMSARAIAIWVADAPTALARTFRPSLFRETVVCEIAPTVPMNPRTELKNPPIEAMNARTIIEPRTTREVAAE